MRAAEAAHLLDELASLDIVNAAVLEIVGMVRIEHGSGDRILGALDSESADCSPFWKRRASSSEVRVLQYQPDRFGIDHADGSVVNGLRSDNGPAHGWTAQHGIEIACAAGRLDLTRIGP